MMVRPDENRAILARLRMLMRAQADVDCHSRSIRAGPTIDAEMAGLAAGEGVPSAR